MSAAMFSIAAVERDTGLSKDLLRVWERRYGFPMPQRDATGERAYPPAQVARLRIVKRLLDSGHRPGRVLSLGDAALQGLAAAEHHQGAGQRTQHAVPSAVEAELEPLLALLRGHDLAALRAMLTDRLQQLGLRDFVLQFAAPLNAAVADVWLQGQLQAFEHRAYTQALQAALRAAITELPAALVADTAGSAPPAPPLPRVLLGTLPGEPQTLGLDLAEALLTQRGCTCITLGAQLQPWDTVQAVAAYRIDIVALGFGGTLGPNAIVQGLTELRTQLPAATALWAGGTAPVLGRRRVASVQPLLALSDVLPELARWQAGHAGSSAAAVV